MWNIFYDIKPQQRGERLFCLERKGLFLAVSLIKTVSNWSPSCPFSFEVQSTL